MRPLLNVSAERYCERLPIFIWCMLLLNSIKTFSLLLSLSATSKIVVLVLLVEAVHGLLLQKLTAIIEVAYKSSSLKFISSGRDTHHINDKKVLSSFHVFVIYIVVAIHAVLLHFDFSL